MPPPRDRSVDGIEIDYGPTGLAIINPWGIFAIDLSSQRFFCTGTRSSPASLVATVTWQVSAVVCQSVEGAPYLLRPSSRHDFRSNPFSPTWLWPVGVLPRDGRLFPGCDRRARSVPRPGPWLVLRCRSRVRARVRAEGEPASDDSGGDRCPGRCHDRPCAVPCGLCGDGGEDRRGPRRLEFLCPYVRGDHLPIDRVRR